MGNDKPKVAVFKFTGCAGCQMELLRMEDELLDIAGIHRQIFSHLNCTFANLNSLDLN